MDTLKMEAWFIDRMWEMRKVESFLNRLMDIVQSKNRSYSLQSKFLSLFLECNLRIKVSVHQL